MLRTKITEQELIEMLHSLTLSLIKINKQISLVTLHADGTIDIIEHNTFNPYDDHYRFGSIDDVYMKTMEDAEKRANQLMEMYQDLKDRERELITVIRCMEKLNPEEYQIIHKLYVENQIWDKVSHDIGLSISGIGRVRKIAISKMLKEYRLLIGQEKEHEKNN